MNRCIYCDDNISIWGDNIQEQYWGSAAYNITIVDNKTRKVIKYLYPTIEDTICYDTYENVELETDIQAAFNLYDKDGNIEHIMPKED